MFLIPQMQSQEHHAGYKLYSPVVDVKERLVRIILLTFERNNRRTESMK